MNIYRKDAIPSHLLEFFEPAEIGLEPTPAEFVAVMVEVFREVRRVLRQDGTLWLNLGDSYAGSGKGGNPEGSQWSGFVGNKDRERAAKPSGGQLWGMKQKDLIGIPWRVAFALQADGWYLRQDIIWSKPNPMPESVTDRCTKAHEYLFLLSKSARYHYDAEAIAEAAIADNRELFRGADKYTSGNSFDNSAEKPAQGRGHVENEIGTRNRRSVWTVATQAFSSAHFATFPPALIEPCIKAGCPKDCCAKCGAPVVRETERIDNGRNPSGGRAAVAATGGAITGGTERSTLGHGGKFNGHAETTGWSLSCTCDAGLVRGTVLDPFGGAGTTGLVADRLQRDAILIELNPEYMMMAKERITDDAPLFAVLT